MALEDFFLLVGAVILIGFVGNLIRQRTNIPDSLFLILFGLVLGPATGLVPGEALLEFVPIISVAAMVTILVESGIGFDIFHIMGSFGKAAMQTILIALITTALITAFLVFYYDWEPAHAALLGLISSGTTTITAMSLLGSLNIPNKIRRLVFLETIMNDFTLILGTFIIVESIKFSTFSLDMAARTIVSELSVGLLIGLVVAMAWRYVLEHINLERKMNYASTIGICFVLYYAAAVLGGNSIVSIFAFSLFLGNYYRIYDFISPKDAEESDFQSVLRSIRSVQTDFSFFMKSFFFVLLGVTFDPGLLGLIPIILIGGLVVLIIISRFLATSVLAFIDKDVAKYRTLISIMIPRGYVAAVLAFVPAQEGVGVPMLTDIIVLLIIVTTLVSIAGVMIYNRTSQPGTNGATKNGGNGKPNGNGKSKKNGKKK